MDPIAGLFDHILDLPNAHARRRLEALIGLDPICSQLIKQAAILMHPTRLDGWSEQFHGSVLPAVQRARQRPPLVILGGDVGTGKTTLAETFADPLARAEQIQICVMRLSLRTRGQGAAGEMTHRIGLAFDLVRDKARILPGVILVIDEADALAQSRELSAMHHEDRAGVNALIRGIDTLVTSGLPVLTVMCTNRLDSLDPAVKRRAAEIFELARPSEEQRRELLQVSLGGAGLTETQIAELARKTGPRNGHDFGYTWSDLSDRLIPSAILAAYPDRPLTYPLVVEHLELITPTKPFAREDES